MTIFSLARDEEWVRVVFQHVTILCMRDGSDLEMLPFLPVLVDTGGGRQYFDHLTADELRELANAMDKAQEGLQNVD